MFIDFPEIHTPIQGIDLVPIPNMVTIRQSYDPTKIEDIKGHMILVFVLFLFVPHAVSALRDNVSTRHAASILNFFMVILLL